MSNRYSSDPLLRSLITLGRLKALSVDATGATRGLALDNGRLTPAAFVDACARIGLQAKLCRRKISDLHPATLPVVILLKDGSSVVVTEWIDRNTVSGEGKVIPSSAMQTVQNLEGGILAEILVREGQSVKAGDVLIRIDDTMTSASYREEVSQRDSLEALLARLRAEANLEVAIRFPDQIVSERPELLAREQALFDKRIGERDKQIEVIGKSLDLANEELSMTLPLVQKQIVSKVEQLRLEREVNEFEGRLLELTEGFQREAMEAYNETKSKLEALVSVLDARKDRVDRTLVRSPISGTVNKLHKTTIGGVIQPGEDIVDIVPKDGTLLVEARINPRDIAFLRPGQKAKVKLTAYDFAIYGGLEGVVEHISADTIQDEIDKQHYYQIKVRNEGARLEKDGKELDIIPGMVAEVDVLTGRRTVLQYLSPSPNPAATSMSPSPPDG